MTKQAKVFRSVICGLVSFILSLTLTLLLVLTGLRLTALNPSYAVMVSQKSSYSEYMLEELKEKYISYGNACNVDESFFDGVFTQIITADQIDRDTKEVLNDFYDNNIKTSIDTKEVDDKMLSALKDYAVSKGYEINESITEILELMVSEMSEMYNAYISMFSSSYFVAAARLLNRYMPYVTYAIIALAVVAIISTVIIRLSYNKARNYLRYYIYACSGTSLMMLVGPAAVLIMGVGGKINIANQSMYGFASMFINYIFITMVIIAVVMAVITAVLAVIRNRAIRQKK